MAFAADGRHLYNRINFAGNKLLQDIFDIALHGLPGQCLIRSCTHNYGSVDPKVFIVNLLWYKV